MLANPADQNTAMEIQLNAVDANPLYYSRLLVDCDKGLYAQGLRRDRLIPA